MPRCGDCNKFVSLDTDTEPDVTSEQLSTSSGTADFDIDVTITNNCAECGTELKTAELNASDSFDYDIAELSEDDRDALTLEVDDITREERVDGAGRSAKTFYGFSATAVLMLNGEELERKSIGDDVQASAMDDA